MRLFELRRDVDETGTSGTGTVAQGVIFDNGWVAMTWLTEHTSVAFYTSADKVVAIHGHDGKTRLVELGGAMSVDRAWLETLGLMRGAAKTKDRHLPFSSVQVPPRDLLRLLDERDELAERDAEQNAKLVALAEGWKRHGRGSIVADCALELREVIGDKS